jgi:pectate lyase
MKVVHYEVGFALLAGLAIATLGACGAGLDSTSSSSSSGGVESSSGSSSSSSSGGATSSISAVSSAASSVTVGLGAAETKAVGYGQAATGAGSSPGTTVTVSTLAAAQAAINAYSGSAGLLINYTGTVDFTPYYNTATYTGTVTKDQNGNVLNTGDVLTCTLHSQSAQVLEIKGSSSKPKNNITLLGAAGSSAQFGIHIAAVSNNIIIRNMTIGLTPGGSDADIISLEGMSAGIPTKIWIDHNTLFTKNILCAGAGDASFDGMIDIKKGVDNVTVSYNYMHDHEKMSLNGYSDSDTTVRHVTFVHNIFETIGSRTPLQRGGYSHMLNNYMSNVKTSAVNVRMGGYSLVEGNYFESVQNPVTSRDSSAIGYWELENNNITSASDFTTYGITWVASSSTPTVDATGWTTTATYPVALGYTYTVDAPACLKSGLSAAAGAGKSLATLTCSSKVTASH